MRNKLLLLLIPILLTLSGCSVQDVFGARTSDFWKSVGTYITTNAPSGFNILINGTSKYLNFNTTVGSGGYGFRDSSGLIQVKHSSGDWTTIATSTSAASSPLTTKGDLYTYTTEDARLEVGINGQVLTASSTASSGLTWATPVSGVTDHALLSNLDYVSSGHTGFQPTLSFPLAVGSSTHPDEADPIWLLASSSYYTKLQIDTQGEVETIWGVSLATDGEVTSSIATKDECSEISGCVVGAITDGNTGWDNSYGFAVGTTTINNVLGNTFTFATGTAGNISLTIATTTGQLTFTPNVATNYGIPLTASTTNWNTFYDTPSNRIADGNGLTWSSNTLNFDGGDTPAGALGGTWASPTIDSDGTWTGHNSYPAACSAGEYVTAVGDTLTCGALTTMTYPGAGIALSTGSAWGASITDNSANWNTAYTDRLKWDGGATGLTAATGRTSLGLGTMALEPNTGSTTITTLGTIGTGTWNADSILNAKIASSTEYLADIGWNGSLVTNASTTNLSVATNSYLGTVQTGLWLGTAIYGTQIASHTQYLVDTGWNGGLVTNASTTNLTVSTDSYFGTIRQGTWNGSAIDISSYTNLTAGDALTLNADDLDFDGGASPGGSLGGTWASPTIDDLFLLNNGDVGTGVYDFGGATSLEVPNGAAMVMTAAGQVVIDTTSDQLRYYGAGTTTLMGTFDKSFWIGSTTPDKSGNKFESATSTFELWNPRVAVELVNLYCKTDTATTTLQCGDGTNWTEQITCSPSGQADDGSITNGTFAAREDFQCKVGSKVGSPLKTTITATFKYTDN